MTGNAATSPPAVPPPKYRRWHGWLYKRIGRWHPSKRRRILAYARASLPYHGRMVYTQGPQRSELFGRKPGEFLGAHADCSQYSASLAHWAGVQGVTNTDYTGTLGNKGVALQEPVPGCFVFFGQPPYVHMGVMGKDRHVIGFGDQAAPERSTLASLIAYFSGQGHPGHAFRDLTR